MAAKIAKRSATSVEAARGSGRFAIPRQTITRLEEPVGAVAFLVGERPPLSLADAVQVSTPDASTSVSEEALANKLIDRAADPSDVKQLCDRYGLRREDLGRLTGFSLRALADWSTGKLPSEPARRRLHEIRRLLDSLAEVVKVEAIASWLKTRNPAFENMTPIQVIEVGEIDRLWQMVYGLGSDVLD